MCSSQEGHVPAIGTVATVLEKDGQPAAAATPHGNLRCPLPGLTPPPPIPLLERSKLTVVMGTRRSGRVTRRSQDAGLAPPGLR